MLGVLVFLLIIVPIAELYVIVQVAHHIGIFETLGLLILLSIAGAWLMKQQGIATWRRLQVTLREGRMPGHEVTDGALILLGGALLLAPGFVTDAIGLLLLMPPTRALLKGVVGRWLGRMARRRVALYTVSPSTVTRFPSDDHPELPRRGEGGSPDRG